MKRTCRPVRKHHSLHHNFDTEYKMLKLYIEAERNTFSFVLGLAVIFITLTTGIMAILFKEDKNAYGYIIILMGFGLLISLCFIHLSVVYINKSHDYDNNIKLFKSSRQFSLSLLKWSIYSSLAFFEVSLILYSLKNLDYVKKMSQEILNIIRIITNMIVDINNFVNINSIVSSLLISFLYLSIVLRSSIKSTPINKHI